MTTYTGNCPGNLAASHVGLTGNLLQTVRQWVNNQFLKMTIQRERARLLTMSDAMLRDMGIDRADAELEANRTDIPTDRRS